jgi:hypothetical protein
MRLLPNIYKRMDYVFAAHQLPPQPFAKALIFKVVRARLFIVILYGDNAHLRPDVFPRATRPPPFWEPQNSRVLWQGIS